jgi:hypothetical protein
LLPSRIYHRANPARPVSGNTLIRTGTHQGRIRDLPDTPGGLAAAGWSHEHDIHTAASQQLSHH